MKFWAYWPVWLLMAALASACAGTADAAEPMDTYRRADALYQQGRAGDACHLLAATVNTPLPRMEAVRDGDYELLSRLARSAAQYSEEAARAGRRSDAIEAASAGMALSRQLMERPDASCQDVREGITLWTIACEGLERAWSTMGCPERARDAAANLSLMTRFAHSVVLPRCERVTHLAVRHDDRMETAEARALVRLWAYHLVRVAANNIS